MKQRRNTLSQAMRRISVDKVAQEECVDAIIGDADISRPFQHEHKTIHQ